MTLAASGQMGIGGSAPRSISVELGRSATATTSLGETAARTLAGVASGAIRMGADFYGKSSASQVTFGAAGTGVSESSLASLTVPLPAGVSAGHIIILQVYAHEVGIGAPTFNALSGWSQIDDVTIGSSRMAVWSRTATGSDADPIVTMSSSGSEVAYGVCYRLSAASTIDSITNTSASAGSTTINGVAVTTHNLGFAMNLMGCRGSSTIGNITGETGADLVELAAEYNVAGISGVMLSAQGAQTATGATVTAGSATLGTSRPDRITIGFNISP